VFLTPEDRAAVLRSIAAHLATGGRFIFDSRNPVAEEWREWTPERSQWVFHHPRQGEVTAWNDVAYDAGTAVATYETHYRVEAGGQVSSCRSRIAFPSRDELSEAIGKAGLRAEKWLGDWLGGPWHPASPEIIPIGSPSDPLSP
jgi:hypothetical protein